MAKFEAGDFRNVVLIGHGAVGKTTLADTILFHAKAVDRKGSVDDGSSHFDYDEEEKHRKSSIDAVMANADWKGKRFHLFDAPGYPDFTSQAISVIHNVETAVITIDAHRGIEVNTRKMFEEAGRAGIARVFLLNKLDTENIHLEALLDRLAETFGPECILLQIPVGLSHEFKNVVDLLPTAGQPVEGASLDVKARYEALIEKIVETDDGLMEKYLEGEVPPPEKLASTLQSAVASGKIIPILLASGKKDIGVTELLDNLVAWAPSPLNGAQRTAKRKEGEVTLAPDATKPFVGRVFKTTHDKFGHFTFVRVYQGTLKPNSAIFSNRDHEPHRLSQINIPNGKNNEKVESIGPGEIAALAKVEGVHIGDVVSDDGSYSMAPVVFPKPMFPLAVSAKSRADDVKLLQSLRKIASEDPCFEIHREEQTHETVMNGISQLHLEVIQHRIKSRDHMELVTHEPKIPYKETVTKPGEGMYRHKKQSGGRGQFAEVHLRLKPRERGAGFEFINAIVGGVIPGQYIPAVEKGIRETMTKGVLAGCEVVDFTAEVFFGKHHDVDSSEAAFKIAASLAFKDAFLKSNPVLLEPIVNLEVVVPSEKMGDVTGDLNSRRAHITGMDSQPGGMQVVKSNVPLAEVLRYQTELKSMTGGQGSFSMDFSHLSGVPAHVQQQIVDKYQQNRKEETPE